MPPRLWLLLVASLGAVSLSAQEPPLTVAQAVERALARYPAVRLSQEQVNAAAAGIRLARTSLLPRADLVGQTNRATRNNVFGLLFPQPVISPISGPPLAVNDLTSVWGTAVGLLVSWEPFDFGRRAAEIAVAQAGRTRAEAALARTRLEVASLAADAALTLLAAEQTVAAAEANVTRTSELQRVIDALVGAELRPGADASRTRAERAAAEVQLLQARQAVALARANLAQLLDLPGEALRVAAPSPAQTPGAAAPGPHPLIQEQEAVIAEARARLGVLDRSFLPRFQVQGTTYARGTGAQADGSVGGALSGLGPNIHNWGLGLTVTFAALDRPGIRARQEVERAREAAETARAAQVRLDLGAAVARAQVTLDTARLIAVQTPVQREAAQAALAQATARYQAGLVSIVDVADAQRLLTQAEIDDRLAQLAIWRATAALAAAQGDLGPLLQSLR